MPTKNKLVFTLFTFTFSLVFVIGCMNTNIDDTNQFLIDELEEHLFSYPEETRGDRIIGPDGGTVTSVAIDPFDQSVIYVGSWGNGVFKSLDGGKRWTQSDYAFPNGYINQIVINSENPSQKLVAVFREGIYFTNDGGDSWLKASGLPERSVVYRIVYHPLESNIVFAALRVSVELFSGYPYPGAVFMSEDGGQSWKNTSEGLPVDYVYDLAFDVIQPDTIFAATHDFGIYQSVDQGENWFHLNDNIHSLSARSVIVNPNNSNLYAGFWRRQGLGFFDMDSQSWHSIWSARNLNLDVYRIFFDHDHDPDNIFLATRTGLIQCHLKTSIMKPADCYRLGLGEYFIFDLAFYRNPQSSDDHKEIILATQQKGIFVSRNRGKSFYESNLGFKTNIILSILNDPNNPDLLYSSVLGGGLFKSEDGGREWFPIQNGLPDDNINQIVFHPNDSSMIYAATQQSGIFRSDDFGNSWKPINQGLSLSDDDENGPVSDYTQDDRGPGRFPEILSIEFDPRNSDNITLGTNGDGAFISLNAGRSWERTSIREGVVQAVLGTISKTTNSFVYGFSDRPIKLYDLETSQIVEKHQGKHENLEVYSISKLSTDQYITGTENGIYKTYNGGKAWIPVGLASLPVVDTLVEYNNPTTIWAATPEGLYKSTNQGYDWHKEKIQNINQDILTLAKGYDRCDLFLGLNGGNIYCFIQ